MNKQLVDEVS